MRAARFLAVALALTSAGCSLLFPPSSYTDERDAGERVDASTDAGLEDDADAPPADASVDASRDDAGDAGAGVQNYWPDCTSAPVDARDVTGASAEPSGTLSARLGLTGGAYGVRSDVPLADLPDDLFMVEMTSSLSGEVFVIVATNAPGDPIVRTVSRDSFATSPVLVSGFPDDGRVLDMSAARLASGPTLVVLVEIAGGDRLIERCVLSASACAFTAEMTDDRILPEAVIAAEITPPIYQVGTSETGSGAYASRTSPTFGFETALGTLSSQLDSRAGASDGLVGLMGIAPSEPWNAVHTDPTGAVDLTPLLSADAAALAWAGDDDYLFISASVDGLNFLLDARPVTCSSADCSCECERTSTVVSDARPIVLDAVYDSAQLVGFAALGTGYDDPGTDVRLYALSGQEIVQVTPDQMHVTLGSGRVGTMPGTLSSMAMTAVFDRTRTDVLEAAIAEVGGSESVYLSGVRYCASP